MGNCHRVGVRILVQYYKSLHVAAVIWATCTHARNGETDSHV